MKYGMIVLALVMGASVGCSGVSGPTQTLGSPCVNNNNDKQMCPNCATDSDCHILSNACVQDAAMCVPKNTGWVVFPTTCEESKKFVIPPNSACGCVQGVCRAK